MSEIRHTAAVIGAGNLSWNLIPALNAAGVEVTQLISRSEEKRKRFAAAYGISSHSASVADIDPAVEWVFLTVGDRQIAGVGEELKLHAPPRAIFLHCSGSTPLAALAPLGDRTGVLYPMQIFTQASVADFRRIPLFLEGNGDVLKKLEPLARALSERVQVLDSEARLRLHLGAVLVCNFPNFLYRLAENLVPEAGIQAYEPLIREHLEKVFAQGPGQTQTGPAIRGDMDTIYQHLTLLQDQPKLRELYWLLSSLIQKSEFRMQNAE